MPFILLNDVGIDGRVAQLTLCGKITVLKFKKKEKKKNSINHGHLKVKMN